MKHSLELFEQPIPVLRSPGAEDGETVASLARSDRHRTLGSLLGDLSAFECFSNTSIIAELGGEIVGAVVAYVPPYDPETLEILQVVVAGDRENEGLASLMLGHLMRRDACAGISRVATTISSADERTWALFRRFARWQGSRMEISPFVTQALTPLCRHENDNQVTIWLGATVANAA